MEAISVKSVSKKFRHVSPSTLKSFLLRDMWKKRSKPAPFWALKDLTFSVKKGATFGIIGQNGSGKSTLLKVIAKIMKPDEGYVSVHGKVSALIELGAGFHPELTGRENIYINGILLGLDKKEINKKIDEIIDFAEIKDFIDEPVRTYSSGMYSRLGFSIAVNVDPDILLIDEVFAVGDVAFVHKCKVKMDEFKRKGKTILLVTHDLTAVENWCDEAVWLSKGAIKEKGSVGDVVESCRQEVHIIESTPDNQQDQQISGTADITVVTFSSQSDSHQSKRKYGSKEIEILNCRLLDADNTEKNIFSYGENLCIEISYKVNKDVEDIVFGMSIWKGDGSICCYGTNTFLEKIRIKSLKNIGKVLFFIEEIGLTEGSYLITVSVHSKEGYTYDRHYQYYGFDVISDIKDTGIYRPRHKWIFNGEI